MAFTPAQVENRLYELSKEIEEAHLFLDESDAEYTNAKMDYEIATAKSMLRPANPELKLTVIQRQHQALLENEAAYRALEIGEQKVRSAKANVARLRIQVDIARSISASIRNEMSVS